MRNTIQALLANPPPLLWPQPASNRADEIRKVIQDLEQAPLSELRKAWKERYGLPVPVPTSPSLLLRFLAWRIQADAFGGHSPEVLRILNEPVTRRKGAAAENNDANLRVGTELKRDWKGRVHQVVVTRDGYGHMGKTYKSLSEVARAITGTKWSGPRFFGLKDSKNRPRARAA
jgi:hypothetical protein